MGSFLQDYINSKLEDEMNIADEDLLERRLSPYATLRPGDLAALLRVVSVSKSNINLGLQLPAPVVLAWKGAGLRDGDYSNQQCKTTAHNLDNTIAEEADDRESTTATEKKDVVDVICKGVDSSHIPATYTVRGIRTHEMPVIGVYVDGRICPGFRYRVRRLGASTDRYLFGNRALTLSSIGMGYGRRLTFEGDSLNNNENYFWSDSEPKGFAFSLAVIDDGLNFIILDTDEVVVGEGIVEKVSDPQTEISTTVVDGVVEKHISIEITCTVRYHQRHHGLVELMAPATVETVTGEAILCKQRSDRKACLLVIDNIFLHRIGPCKFEPDV